MKKQLKQNTQYGNSMVTDLDSEKEEYHRGLEETERLKEFRRRKEKELRRRRRNHRLWILMRTVIILAVCGAGICFAVRKFCPGLPEKLVIRISQTVSGSRNPEEKKNGESEAELSGEAFGETEEERGGESAAEEPETDKTEEMTTEEPTTEELRTKAPDPREDVWNHYENLFVVSKIKNYLNVRDQPTQDGNIIGKLVKYAGGEILEDLGDWYHISSGEIDGYIASEYCVTGEEAKQVALEHCYEMVEVTAERLNVRSGPGEEYEVWTQLSASEKQVVESEEGEWLKILINSTYGYINREYTQKGFYLAEAMPWSSISNYSETRQALFNYAEQFIGTPYVFGGESLHFGIDCSSYVQQCFRNAIGIQLPRTSRDQVNRGAAISLAEAKPGDLLFYAGADGVVNHVAMYLGDGKILHAAQSLGQVIVSKYNYATEPVAVRNIIGD